MLIALYFNVRGNILAFVLNREMNSWWYFVGLAFIKQTKKSRLHDMKCRRISIHCYDKLPFYFGRGWEAGGKVSVLVTVQMKAIRQNFTSGHLGFNFSKVDIYTQFSTATAIS